MMTQVIFGIVLVGVAAATFLITRAITQKKIMEKAVEKFQWYESMLDAIPFPISVTDMNMSWTFINKPAESVTGKKRTDVVGTQCSSWGADICKTDRCGIQMLRSGKPTSFFTQPGLDMDFQVDVAYLTNAKGEKVGHIEVVQDISSKSRATEYQKKASHRVHEALNQLAQGVLNVSVDAEKGDKHTADVEKVFIAINTAINNMASSMKSVIQKILDTSTTLSAHSEESSATSHQIASSIEELNASFSEISRVFQNEKAVTQQAMERIKQVREAVNKLQDAGKEISKVSEVIGNIADQTNLLALNATIEAASAGDAGKGFAVVAAEVKDLSKQTQNSVKEIETIVNDVLRSVNLVSEQTDAINKIVSEDLNSMTLTLSSSVEEQSATISEIARTASNTSQSSTELARMSSDLKTMTSQFSL